MSTLNKYLLVRMTFMNFEKEMELACPWVENKTA